ncbi:MAG: hypothetical protein AB7N76_16530 [Planctomycetota bacterium]
MNWLSHRPLGAWAVACAAIVAAGSSFGGCTGGGGGGGGLASTTAPATSLSPSPLTSGSSAGVVSASAPALVPQAPANLATGPRLIIDASGASFFDWPYPFDARRDAQGHPDLSKLPNPRHERFIDDLFALASGDSDGFSPTGAIYLRFDAPLNAPPGDALASQVQSDILLVNVDPSSPEYLRRTPFRSALTARGDTIRPANLLQLLPEPGRNLRPKTTYAAIVLRSLGAPGTQWLGQDPVTTVLLSGQEPLVPQGAAMARAFAPLVSALPALGIHPQDVACATVFSTNDPTERLARQVAWLETQPAPPTRQALSTRDVYPAFTALVGSIEVPQYQDGYTPFLFQGGRQVLDAQGLPVRQRVAVSQVQLSVPKGTMPAKGFPLYFYCHGTGGKASQAVDRGRCSTPTTEPPPGSGIASYVAPQGWGTACMAGPFSPDRIGIMAADGYLAYNFLNPVAMRDNFLQMVLEQVHFLNWLREVRIDPALCPGTDASASVDGKVRFDVETSVVGGQSLGSYLAGMLAATVRGWKGAVLTGAGGSWVEFAFGPKVPFDLQLVVELLGIPFGEKLDRFHPLIMAFDLGVGPADNTHYHRYVLREPLPGHAPPHVLVIEGHKDLQVAVGLQRALTLAIGLDFVGNDPAPTPDEQLLPVLPLANLAQLPYPVGGNRLLPSGERRTAVVVRYPEDGIREGHYVSFQLDEPKRQVREFLDALVAGQVPTIR